MKKLFIVGGGDSLLPVPFDNPENEIWAIGYQVDGKEIPRADRCFEMHNRPPANSFDYGKGKPVEYVVNGQADYPEDVLLYEYPLKEVCKFLKLDLSENKFFRSSIDYMLALAIYEGYQHIELHRCQMTAKEEYYYQRQSLNYLIGFARAIGRTVVISKDSEAFFSPWLYGYEDPIDIKIMEGRLYAIVKLRLKAFERYKKYYGAYNQLLGYLTTNRDRLSLEQIAEVEAKISTQEQLSRNEESDINYFEGALQCHGQFNELLK